MLETQKAKSIRESTLDVTPQMANFGFLAEGPECRDPEWGNLLYYPSKCSLSFEKKSPGGRRRPISGKMDTLTLLTVPPEAGGGGFRAQCQQRRIRAGAVNAGRG